MTELFTEKEKSIVRALQKDLPLVKEPYKQIAEELGMTEAELLEGIEGLKERGCLKRISIALRHKNVGYKVNVMVVWNVPEDNIDELALKAAQHPGITHCYRRGPQEKFPYNLYTMTHAQSEEEFAKMIEEIRDIIGRDVDYEQLRSVNELKKIGMKYFLEKPEDIIEA